MCGPNVLALHRNRVLASLFTSFRRRLPAQVGVPKGRDPAVEHVLHLCKARWHGEQGGTGVVRASSKWIVRVVAAGTCEVSCCVRRSLTILYGART